MSITIRKASEADIALLNPLRYELFLMHHQQRPDIVPAAAWAVQEENHIRTYLADATCAVYLAEEDGILAGFVIAQTKLHPHKEGEPNRSFTHIHEIYVTNAFRRQGVATLLMQTVKGEAERLGCGRLALKVWAFNESALALYKALGFDAIQYEMDLRL